MALMGAGAFDDEALPFKGTGVETERVIDEAEDSSG